MTNYFHTWPAIWTLFTTGTIKPKQQFEELFFFVQCSVYLSISLSVCLFIILCSRFKVSTAKLLILSLFDWYQLKLFNSSIQSILKKLQSGYLRSVSRYNSCNYCRLVYHYHTRLNQHTENMHGKNRSAECAAALTGLFE